MSAAPAASKVRSTGQHTIHIDDRDGVVAAVAVLTPRNELIGRLRRWSASATASRTGRLPAAPPVPA